jgi:hypothetical protein
VKTIKKEDWYNKYLDAFLRKSLSSFESVVESDAGTEDSGGFTVSDEVSFTCGELGVIGMN